MRFVVTSSHRRLVMVILLGLAVLGGAIRAFATNPSAWRDIGTVLMVLWLPAIGSVIGYLQAKIPPSAPPPSAFPQDANFLPQLRVHLEKVALPAGFVELLDATQARGTVILGRRGFTVRMVQPVREWLSGPAAPQVDFELLSPGVALPYLPPGTHFHLLLGTTAVAKGRVCEIIGA